MPMAGPGWNPINLSRTSGPMAAHPPLSRRQSVQKELQIWATIFQAIAAISFLAVIGVFLFGEEGSGAWIGFWLVGGIGSLLSSTIVQVLAAVLDELQTTNRLLGERRGHIDC